MQVVPVPVDPSTPPQTSASYGEVNRDAVDSSRDDGGSHMDFYGDSVVDGADGADAVHTDHENGASVLGKRSVPANDREDGAAPAGPSTEQRAGETEDLAEQLAARFRNPRVFQAAFWMPNAQSVLAAAQSSRAAAGPPPASAFVTPNTARVAATIPALPLRAATLPPPPPWHHRPAAKRTASPTQASVVRNGDSSS